MAWKMNYSAAENSKCPEQHQDSCRNQSRLPFWLLGGYLLEVVLLGISPADRTTWLAENITALIPVTVLCVMYWRGIRFSNTAYLLMMMFFVLHTIGGHYTFAKVPLDPVMDFFGFERNHFDRVCHFLVGTFAFPALEYLDGKKMIRSRAAAALLVILGIFGVAAVFELVEWIYAELAEPEAGLAFLGSQGDIWDAQKDMLADGLGGCLTVGLYRCLRWGRKHRNLSV